MNTSPSGFRLEVVPPTVAVTAPASSAAGACDPSAPVNLDFTGGMR